MSSLYFLCQGISIFTRNTLAKQNALFCLMKSSKNYMYTWWLYTWNLGLPEYQKINEAQLYTKTSTKSKSRLHRKLEIRFFNNEFVEFWTTVFNVLNFYTEVSYRTLTDVLSTVYFHIYFSSQSVSPLISQSLQIYRCLNFFLQHHKQKL